MNETPQIDGHTVKIIVVDDEEIVLSLVRDALEDAGYEIELAGNSLQALQKMEREYFDFVLTDIRMPEIDGIELARRARELNPNIGVIFMTGYANLNTAKDAIKEGAYDYIMKPFELNEIRQAVKNAVAKKQKDAEKSLATELSRLSDLNQLMYTVGDRKSLIRLSLGFALMQAKSNMGSIAFKDGNENEIGVVSTGQGGMDTIEEAHYQFSKNYFDFQSEEFDSPFITSTLEEHPLYKAFKNPEIASFLIPSWHTPDSRLVNIALRRGSNLYGFLMLAFPIETEMLKASDLKLLTITANQIAISLENIILLEETRLAYQRLKELQEQTIQLEKMAIKGQMSAEIGHELNNFVGVVYGNFSLLEYHLNQKHYDELEKYLTAAKSNLDNIKKFSRGLMDFSVMSSNFQFCDVGVLVASVIEYMKAQKHFQQIDINCIEPEESIFTMADADQLQQLLYNMINNAAEAILSRPTGEPPEISIRIERKPDENNFKLTIADNGVGIEKNFLEKAFNERFTTKKSGHGFGLLVCKRIIDNHGAKLEIESEPGHGTSISMTFPIKSPSSVQELSSEKSTTI
jgi:signal transduction histidine kinase/CheY-like chemotaxis protein